MMRTTTKTIAMTFVAALAVAVMPTAAHAATEETPRVVSTGDDRSVEEQINAIPIDSLREETAALLAQREAEGATVVSVTYAPYERVETSEEVSLLAAPDDCGFSTAILVSPGRVSQDAVASCTTTLWNTNTLKLTIVGINPFNGLDTAISASDSFTNQARRDLTGSIFHRCTNSDRTVFEGQIVSTLNVGGVDYTNEGSDRSATIDCGR